MPVNDRNWRKSQETLQRLSGERGNPRDVALRRRDLRGLGDFRVPMATGTPTAEAFNALREEVLRLHMLLAAAARRR